jgi:hypothetical protein
LPDRHWVLEVHVVPGQDAAQVPPRQLPLWHWLFAVQVPEPP